MSMAMFAQIKALEKRIEELEERIKAIEARKTLELPKSPKAA